MVLRLLMRYILNEKTIERLSESYPIRRAAQWTIYFFLKGKSAVEGEQGRKALQMKDKLIDEVKKEWQKAQGIGKKP